MSLGKVQLPDFQRDWKWDDDRVASLLAPVSLGYPVGVVMMLETGGDGVRFKPKPLAGVPANGAVPEQLLLDGQQGLTSLFQSLYSGNPVDTYDARGKRLRRWYYIDIARALGDEGDREDAILSVPEERVVYEDFGRRVAADYSTTDAECAAGVFPLHRVFEGAGVLNWTLQYLQGGDDRLERWKAFQDGVLEKFTSYLVPVIKLTKTTPKEAVCTVFEKVNTGGIALNVFELLTAQFAGEQRYYDEHGQDFRLNDDWRQVQERLRPHRVLRGLESSNYLQAITLLATRARQEAHLSAGGDPASAPGVSCRRKDILKLTLEEYLRWSPQVVKALEWAGIFLSQQRIFRAGDIPYRTQLVPLAAIRVVLGTDADKFSIDEKLRRWYWCGVLGELYGGAVETRFARDLEQVVPWVRGGSGVPTTVAEASFHEQRLLTMRTRNSAAYKGPYALLMRAGALDWTYNQPLNMRASTTTR